MTKYKLNEDKIFADIADGIAILINIDTGIYYGMNKLGTLVYENFLQGVTAESILEKLKSWNAESEKGFNEYMNFINEHSIMLKESGDSDDREVFLYEEIAKEVIAGKWGNGQDRKNKLSSEGYEYSQIQKIVNQLLGG